MSGSATTSQQKTLLLLPNDASAAVGVGTSPAATQNIIATCSKTTSSATAPANTVSYMNLLEQLKQEEDIELEQLKKEGIDVENMDPTMAINTLNVEDPLNFEVELEKEEEDLFDDLDKDLVNIGGLGSRSRGRKSKLKNLIISSALIDDDEEEFDGFDMEDEEDEDEDDEEEEEDDYEDEFDNDIDVKPPKNQLNKPKSTNSVVELTMNGKKTEIKLESNINNVTMLMKDNRNLTMSTSSSNKIGANNMGNIVENNINNNNNNNNADNNKDNHNNHNNINNNTIDNNNIIHNNNNNNIYHNIHNSNNNSINNSHNNNNIVAKTEEINFLSNIFEYDCDDSIKSDLLFNDSIFNFPEIQLNDVYLNSEILSDSWTCSGQLNPTNVGLNTNIAAEVGDNLGSIINTEIAAVAAAAAASDPFYSAISGSDSGNCSINSDSFASSSINSPSPTNEIGLAGNIHHHHQQQSCNNNQRHLADHDSDLHNHSESFHSSSLRSQISTRFDLGLGFDSSGDPDGTELDNFLTPWDISPATPNSVTSSNGGNSSSNGSSFNFPLSPEIASAAAAAASLSTGSGVGMETEGFVEDGSNVMVNNEENEDVEMSQQIPNQISKGKSNHKNASGSSNSLLSTTTINNKKNSSTTVASKSRQKSGRTKRPLGKNGNAAATTVRLTTNSQSPNSQCSLSPESSNSSGESSSGIDFVSSTNEMLATTASSSTETTNRITGTGNRGNGSVSLVLIGPDSEVSSSTLLCKNSATISGLGQSSQIKKKRCYEIVSKGNANPTVSVTGSTAVSETQNGCKTIISSGGAITIQKNKTMQLNQLPTPQTQTVQHNRLSNLAGNIKIGTVSSNASSSSSSSSSNSNNSRNTSATSASSAGSSNSNHSTSGAPVTGRPRSNAARNSRVIDIDINDEERRLLSKEGYPNFPSNPHSLTKHEEKILRKIRRKIRNKRSAQSSRQRKKEYVEELERRYAESVNVVQYYKKECIRLRREKVDYLRRFQNFVFCSGDSASFKTSVFFLFISFIFLSVPYFTNQSKHELEIGNFVGTGRHLLSVAPDWSDSTSSLSLSSSQSSSQLSSYFGFIDGDGSGGGSGGISTNSGFIESILNPVFDGIAAGLAAGKFYENDIDYGYGSNHSSSGGADVGSGSAGDDNTMMIFKYGPNSLTGHLNPTTANPLDQSTSTSLFYFDFVWHLLNQFVGKIFATKLF